MHDMGTYCGFRLVYENVCLFGSIMIILLIETPIFEWYMTRFVVEGKF